MADQNEHLTDFEEGARRALEWLGRSEDAAEASANYRRKCRQSLATWKRPSSSRSDGLRSPGIRPRLKLKTKQRHGQLRCHRRRRLPQRHGSTSMSSGAAARARAAARFEELAGRNANAFVEMHHAFAPNRPKGADWS